MYKTFSQFAEKILRIPTPPEHPPGDEHTSQIFHAAPNFYKYLLVAWAIKTALFCIPAAFAITAPTIGGFALINHGNKLGMLLLLLSFVLLAALIIERLFALAVVRLDFEKRWYVITDRSLRIREGIMNVREMTVNFANIQNISISQGPIQRLLAIADLRVDTAGAAETPRLRPISTSAKTSTPPSFAASTTPPKSAL